MCIIYHKAEEIHNKIFDIYFQILYDEMAIIGKCEER